MEQHWKQFVQHTGSLHKIPESDDIKTNLSKALYDMQEKSFPRLFCEVEIPLGKVCE